MARIEQISEKEYREHPYTANSNLSATPQGLENAFRFGRGFHELTQGLPLTVELSRDEMKMASNMKRAFKSNAFVNRLMLDFTLEGIETKHFNDVYETKAMCDFWLKHKNGHNIILELKSTSCSSAKAFKAAAVDYDYMRAAVHYLETTGALWHVIVGVQKDDVAPKVFTYVTKRGTLL